MSSSVRLLPVLAAALAMLSAQPLVAAPVDSVPAGAFGTFWYTLDVLGSRGGWSQQTLRRVTRDDRTWVEAAERAMVRVKMGAETLTASQEELRRYDADLRLVYLEQHADEFGRKSHLVAERRGDKLHVVKEAPDGVTTRDLDLPADFGLELTALQALGEGQISAGWTRTFSTFDTDLAAFDRIEVKVAGRADTPRPCWKILSRSALLKFGTVSYVSDDGVLLRQEAPDVLNMVMVLATEQEALKEVAPLLLSAEVPVDRELGEAGTLRELRLRLSMPTGSAADLFPTTRRQSVQAEDGQAVVTVRAATAPAQAGKLPITGAEFAPYLAPSDTAQNQDPAIQAKAREVVGDETDAWKALGRLNRWVHDSLQKVSSEPRPVSAVEVLREMKGDCTEHAILMAALCQAVGLPAKMVAGLAYDRKAFHYHAWNEVYVGEWVEVDATWGEALVDAGHLQVAAAALDSTSLSAMSLAAGRTLGSLKIEVLDCKTAL